MNLLNSQPLFIREMIYHHLPEREKFLIAPRISKCWYSICEQNYFQTASKICQKKRFFSCRRISFTNEQINKIIKLAKQNNFLCLVKPVRFENIHGHESSEDFVMTWDFEKLKILNKGQWGYFLTRCNFRKESKRSKINNRYRYRDVKLFTFLDLYSSKKGGFIFWNKSNRENISHITKHALIVNAIDLQIKMHLKMFSNLNVETISTINTNTILKSQSQILFNFNKDGQILDKGCVIDTKDKIEKSKKFYLVIKKQIVEDKNVIYLKWFDKSEVKTIADRLRRNIYFLTTKKFAKQIEPKLQIKCFIKIIYNNN